MLIVSAIALIGCASDSSPAHPLALSTEPWTYEGRPARNLRTSHYLIHTTISDEKFLQRLAQTLETSLDQYHNLAPEVPLTTRPMDCYIFATREQWSSFTRTHTGDDAPIYLKINRGGFTLHDWYVAYYLGDRATFAVAAHEGFHQFVARHFKGRLPPFLEEGLACMFESTPDSRTGANPSRAVKLSKVIQGHHLYPLEQLIQMPAAVSARSLRRAER